MPLDFVNSHSPNWLSEYGEYFLDFLENTLENRNNTSIDQEEIKAACLFIEEKFKWIKRKSWEDYHSHLYEVAKILIEHKRKNLSTEAIIIALLHDTLEDIPQTPEEYEELFKEIQRLFWDKVAIWVKTLSKPSQDENKEIYKERLKSLAWIRKIIVEASVNHNIVKFQHHTRWGSKNASRKLARTIWIIKLCDRIHNLRTMEEDTYPNFKREKKVRETEETLSHLAREIWNTRILRCLDKALFHARITSQRVSAKSAISSIWT